MTNMSRISRWRDARGKLNVELELVDDVWLTASGKREFPTAIGLEKPEGAGTAEILMEVSSCGYYDPGRNTGCPDSSYPPEGEDERALVAASSIFYNDDGEKMKEATISFDNWGELERFFSEEINSLNINTDQEPQLRGNQ